AALESDQKPSTQRSRATAAQAATQLLVGGATEKRRTVGRSDGRTVQRSDSPTVRRRLGWVVLAIALPVLALGAGALFFRQPTLVFENRLTDMVAVQVGGEERRIQIGRASCRERV